MEQKINKKEVEEDIGKYKALQVVVESEGGEILIQSLNKDIINTIDWLSSNYKTASHSDLIARCALISSHLGVLRTLKNASKNIELAEAALKEL